MCEEQGGESWFIKTLKDGVEEGKCMVKDESSI
jgi:hypothetical protein